MRRYLLPALLLLAVSLAWILRSTQPVPVTGGELSGSTEAALDPELLAVPVERAEARTDEGRMEPAEVPAPGGGWVLTGRVWGENGEPVSGVSVRFISGVSQGWGAGDARFFWTSRPDYATAETNEDGRYVIHLRASPAPSFPQWLFASPGILCDRHAGRPALKVLPIEFREHGGACDLVLRPGAGITGRVLSPSGAPAAFAQITSSAGMVWTADESGRFRAPMPKIRDLDISFQHESGVLILTGLKPPLADDLALGDLVLKGPGHLAGRVILPDGSPAPQIVVGFTARASRENSDSAAAIAQSAEGRQEAWTITDAAGAFHVLGLTLDDFLPSCQAMGTVIPLTSQGAPVGAATWLRSGPESDGHLLVLPWRLLLLDVPEYSAEMESLNYEIYASAVEGPDPPAPAEFRLLAQGYANEEELPIVFLYDSATWIRVSAVAGTQLTGTALFPIAAEPWLARVALALEPFGATGKIMVRGVSASGAPITQLTIELRDPGAGTTVLGAWPRRVEGGVEIQNVPSGLWSLTLSSANFANGLFVLSETQTVEVRAGETRELEWRPREGGMLQIVVDTDGTGSSLGILPAITATVLEGPAHVGNRLNLVENGRERQRRPAQEFPPATVMAVAGVLEPGAYRIRFEAAGFEPVEASIEVQAADVVRLEARLSAAP